MVTDWIGADSRTGNGGNGDTRLGTGGGNGLGGSIGTSFVDDEHRWALAIHVLRVDPAGLAGGDIEAVAEIPAEVQIRHEAIPDFVDMEGRRVGMDAMTMPFSVVDRKLLETPLAKLDLRQAGGARCLACPLQHRLFRLVLEVHREGADDPPGELLRERLQ